jgi:hypothetical protein
VAGGGGIAASAGAAGTSATGGSPGGGVGGTAMGTAGTGGMTGGAGTGTPGTAGTSGAAGGTTGTAITDIVPGLDGYYWEVTPSGSTPLSGTNYPLGPPDGGCPTGSTWDTSGYTEMKTPLTVGGTAGQRYTININGRGVVPTRCYVGGTPGSTAVGNPTGPNNTWYAGGSQYGDTIWATMEIHVEPKVAGQPNQGNSGYDVYYVNSFQDTSNWCEKETLYEARFDASFPVMGGGTITFVVHDSNCRTIANCGPVEQAPCNTGVPLVIDMSGLDPPASNFTQPPTVTLDGPTYLVEWLWIDVTSVTSP